jgi:hypothetical protein
MIMSYSISTITIITPTHHYRVFYFSQTTSSFFKITKRYFIIWFVYYYFKKNMIGQEKNNITIGWRSLREAEKNSEKVSLLPQINIEPIFFFLDREEEIKVFFFSLFLFFSLFSQIKRCKIYRRRDQYYSNKQQSATTTREANIVSIYL